MLTDTLLDSSPAREPVLHGRHWLTTLAAAVAGFCLAWFGLPLAEMPQIRVLATQSLMVAAVSFFSALMLAYVYADSRHLGLRTWPWLVLTFMLNIAGFLGYLVYSAWKTGNWKRASLPVAYMVEVMVIGVMVIIPLIHSEALPKSLLGQVTILPLPPPAAPPAAAPRVEIPQITVEDLEKEPAVIPRTIAKFRSQPAAPSSGIGVVGSVPGVPGGQDGVIDSLIGATAPPPPAPAKPATPGRIKLGGVVEAANLIYGPKPEYPQLAKLARIQGTVRLEALIATDGTIKDLKVVSGHPLLVRAALDAVERWRYRPTLLNGEPVEVETEIDVNFSLEQ